jgi:signal transduction histidine kinase
MTEPTDPFAWAAQDRDFIIVQWTSAGALLVSDELLLSMALLFAVGVFVDTGAFHNSKECAAEGPIRAAAPLLVAYAKFPKRYVFFAFIAFIRSQMAQVAFWRKHVTLGASVVLVAHTTALAFIFCSTESFVEFRKETFTATQLGISSTGSLVVAAILRLPFKVTAAILSFTFLVHGSLVFSIHAHLSDSLAYYTTLGLLLWASFLFVAYWLEKSQHQLFIERRTEIARQCALIHDFRMPLHGVDAMVKAVLSDVLSPPHSPLSGEGGALSERAKERLARAQHGCEIMESMVNDAKAIMVNDKQALVLEPSAVTMVKRVCTVLEFVRPLLHPNVTIEGEIDADVPEVLVVDSTRLSQVLIQLLTSAANYTTKGHIKLGCSVKHDGDSRLVQLRLNVRRGIAAHSLHLEQNAKMHQQANELPPYGLKSGHAMCEQLVQSLGGKIEFMG